MPAYGRRGDKDPKQPRFVGPTFDRAPSAARDDAKVAALTVAYHADLSRIGERALLSTEALAERRGVAVTRLEPSFAGPGGEVRGPLDDPFLSRRAIVLRAGGEPGSIEIANPAGVELRIGGEALGSGEARTMAAEEIARGVDLELADRAVLLLHQTKADPDEGEGLGMVGSSDAMRALRDEIRRTAAHTTKGAVLLRGETGAGKELVARALHQTGARASRPFVAVNMAAVSAGTAAAELFGHKKGAFTGADRDRPGHFQRAGGGVLFLDEIGETPHDIQPMLLRALESGEVQPVGGEPEQVDVLIIAATDADLEALVEANRFRAALLHRLASADIRVPPLRERRADLGPLVQRFLLEELEGETRALEDAVTEPELWLGARTFARLLRERWPGNVRQLRNVARHLASIAKGGGKVRAGDLDRLLGRSEPDLLSEPIAREEDTAEIDEDRLIAVLREHRFQLNRAAKALGMSRSGLDARIARSTRLKKAKDLTKEEILACSESCGGDVDEMAAKLEVSARGLRLRMTQLGLS